MTASEFIEKLKLIPSLLNKYRKELGEEFIANEIRRYTCSQKRIRGCYFSDPILSLISGFDVSELEIGMLGFNEVIVEAGDFVLVGRFESDDIAIHLLTGEIVLLEEGTDHITRHVAANSARFLEALIYIAAFLQRRGIDHFLYENEKVNLSTAEECAELAGSEKYVGFYRMMLGV